MFSVLGVIFLARDSTGRGSAGRSSPIGKNKDAARYSGVRVGTLKTALFVLTGLVAALAGVILTARFSSARADNGTGLTLIVVTIVLLGGVDINGGKGTIPGVILAVFTLAVLQNALRLASVSSRVPEHRRRAAPDRLGHRSLPCSPGQVVQRSSSERPAPAGRPGRTWRGRSIGIEEETVS